MKTLHTAYRVSDLERSLTFYRTVGFREIGRVATGDESLLVMLHLPDDGDVVTLELVHAPVRGAVEIGTGFRQIVVQVDDLAGALATLAAAGITCGEIEHPGGEAGPAISNLYDRDGYCIELVQWPLGHPDDMTSADFR